MKTIPVYQLDENSFYIFETVADESPLEPGIFHIPRGCILTPPPNLKKYQKARWNGKQYSIVTISKFKLLKIKLISFLLRLLK